MTTSLALVDFEEGTFRPIGETIAPSPSDLPLLRSLIYRPAIFRRNGMRWIAACAWRSGARAHDLAALKEAKRNLDPQLIEAAGAAVAALVRELLGERPASAVTAVPCGHSRRPDCFGKRLAQAVASDLGLPFVQIFADRPCSGVSHPKEFARLPPLTRIAEPPGSLLLIDDVATSGQHLEEAVSALRRLGVAVSAVAWISGSLTGTAASGAARVAAPLRSGAVPRPRRRRASRRWIATVFDRLRRGPVLPRPARKRGPAASRQARISR